MKPDSDQYKEYVEHPRYGRRPLITGLNPNPLDPDVHLHWNAITHPEVRAKYEAMLGRTWPYGDLSDDFRQTTRIPHTAVKANLSQQTPATVPVTHYFDLKRTCRDCHRPFIFFAKEQQHWYEELGFGLESDCVCCVECRKKQQGIARQREIYESLFHVPEKNTTETIDMASACLELMVQGIFTKRQTARVRMLLNSLPEEMDDSEQSRYRDLLERLQHFEAKGE